MQSTNRAVTDTLQNALSRLTQTRLNYWAEFAVDIPFGVVLIFAGLRRQAIGPLAGVLIVLLGLLLFSLFEYAFHRWLFHGSVEIFAQGHRSHHENPQGYDSLPFFFPALVLLALAGVLVALVPAAYALLLTGVVTLSYVVYGVSHFTIHHHLFRHALARDWAAKHHIHHYHADTNFGVTTALWDIVFGTRYKRAPR